MFSYVFQQIDNFIKKHRRGQQFVEAPMLLCKLNTMDKTGITVLPNNLLYVWPETDRIRGTPKAEETRTHRQYNGGKF